MNFKPDFTFKRFAITHQNCAMKVNTDGILLASWVQTKQAKNILDIGTGTGLIALMLAQRTENNEAQIDAVEVDANACNDARLNVSNSPWQNRMCIHQSDIRNWTSANKYDVVVSNPPYFNNSLLSDKQNKNLARHTNDLSFSELITSLTHLVTEQATFNVILPCTEAANFIEHADKSNWHPNHITSVKTVSSKAASRQLICFSRCKKPLLQDQIIIKDTDNQYSAEFVALTQDFYLFM